MANTSVFRAVAPTTAISVSATSSTAVTITASGNDQINYCGFLNTNSFPVAVNIAPTSAGTAVLPAGGATSSSVILGVTMSTPMVLAVPAMGGGQGFSVTTVAGTGNSGVIYVTPMADQS